MVIEFDFANVQTTQFGVGIKEQDSQRYYLIPVNNDVQNALREISVATRDAMTHLAQAPVKYQPSEKHASTEYLHLPIGDDLAERMRTLHQANNLDINAEAIEKGEDIFCYFARMTDGQGRRLTGLRRASQFKGVLKKRLITFITDTLRLVEDDIFKLDNDFDLLIDAVNVHILRPTSFELVSELQAVILNAVPRNVKVIEKHLAFVDFSEIQAYSSKHPRAAKYLASIREQGLENISKQALTRACKSNGIEVVTVGKKLIVNEDDVMDFLEILDRRRYRVDLVTDAPELFRAASRQKVQ